MSAVNGEACARFAPFLPSPLPGQTDLRLLDACQRGFPLHPAPFAAIGARLGVAEAEVLARLQRLHAAGALSRIGPVFAPNRVGASLLAALAVPEAALEAVAARVSALPETNHNYAREHRWNLWFVLTGPDRGHLDAVLDRLETDTGLAALRLPLEREYRIDLAFALSDLGPGAAGPCVPSAAGGEGANARFASMSPGRFDTLDARTRALVAAVQDGLALVPRPYAVLAGRLGWGEAEVLAALCALLEAGTLRRFGAVVRHHELGFAANAMVVWDVPDREVDALGARLAQAPGVTLCYRRPRRLPDWRYNLFTMIHGRDRAAVLAQLAATVAREGLEAIPHAPLFSNRRFKQRGARFAGLRPEEGTWRSMPATA